MAVKMAAKTRKPRGPKEDLTGQKFGRLTVLEYVNIYDSPLKGACWKCECECGNIKYSTTGSLKNGSATSCGCLTTELLRKPKVDYTGMVFGKLTVLEWVEKTDETPGRWKCQCECGNICYVLTHEFKRVNQNSCGCSIGGVIDLKDRVFGRLTVIRRAENIGGYVAWECECECGNVVVVRSQDLMQEKTKSCGCLKIERTKETMITHGLSKHPLYFVWAGMMSRTYNPENEEYKRYGGRGISVCDEWHDVRNFIEWGEKEYQSGLTLDRINVNGNYEPDNCRWATLKEQGRNRRNTLYVEYNGERVSVALLAEQHNMRSDTLSRRLQRGWSIEKSLNTPVRKTSRRRREDVAITA